MTLNKMLLYYIWNILFREIMINDIIGFYYHNWTT